MATKLFYTLCEQARLQFYIMSIIKYESEIDATKQYKIYSRIFLNTINRMAVPRVMYGTLHEYRTLGNSIDTLYRIVMPNESQMLES